ncbi:hypothetical protein CYMTET_21055 [Cymbomonas tetramitiformis]|uniref:Bax inhibitor 1 n=1 Tax=Cymbomonas tetramitiformis TaxID=36881 RepID=A0AAE0G2V5_9CHLO|nr:hypothetical protein CYMTET_21055 [Cymbomonas tetramitiformis]
MPLALVQGTRVVPKQKGDMISHSRPRHIAISAHHCQVRQQAFSAFKQVLPGTQSSLRAGYRVNLKQRRQQLQVVSYYDRQQTSNPALQHIGNINYTPPPVERDTNADPWAVPSPGTSNVMTVQGTMGKTAILLAIAAASAACTWAQIYSGSYAAAMAIIAKAKMAGIAAFVVALVTAFKPQWSMVTAPLYAVCKGICLAGMSIMMERLYPGIAMQAVCLTLGSMMSLLTVYQLNMIQVTERFRSMVMLGTGGFCFMLLGTYLLRFFGVVVPLSTGPTGLAFCAVSLGLAAANLLTDFDFIERVSRQRMPKYMEWYSGFSLMVTLVWMYTTILRLLGMMRSSD